VNSDLWEDEKIRKVSVMAAYLFFYLITNLRCPPSGMYKLAKETIAFETRISNLEIDGFLDELIFCELIAFDPQKNAFWIKGKIKHHKPNNRDYSTLKSIKNDIDNFEGVSWYQDFLEKYPNFIDCAIELAEMKRIKYHDKALTNHNPGVV
jgi:hypothetical protein